MKNSESKLPWYYKGDFRAEQDHKYESEQDANNRWHKTKKVSVKTWTIYKFVRPETGSGYETPFKFCKNEAEAKAFMATL